MAILVLSGFAAFCLSTVSAMLRAARFRVSRECRV
jgi:hypothetical protein